MKPAVFALVVALVVAASAGSNRSYVSAQVAPAPGQGTAESILEGELEVQYEDWHSGSRLNHFLRSDDGRRLRLQFFADAPALLTGTRVRVRGRFANGTLMLTSGTSVQTVALASPNTFGPQSTIVILVNFQDNPSAQPYTPASASDATFVSTNAFYQENSYGQTSLTGDVFGWFTIALSSTSCDTSTLATLADQAAVAAGADLSAYSRRIYGFPSTNACGWWGVGTVGGNPSKAWINGTYSLRVVSHEFGHNLGAFHSRSESCDGIVCTIYEYGDDHDTMGSTTAHLNAFQKERLGWLNYGVSPPLATVGASGAYRVEAYESMNGGTKGLKILKSVDPTTGWKTWYYVEQRAKIGFDSNVAPGVLVHTGSESSGNSSYQKDLAPFISTFDAVLDVGQSFSDAALGLTITTLSSDGSGAEIAVDFASATCVRSEPAVSLSPSQSPWMTAGSTFSYTVSVTSSDSAGCAAAAFDLAATMPSGWTASFASPSLTIGPGSSASTTLQVTSASTVADGSYPVGAAATNAADPTKSGSASATYVVLSSLTVQTSTNQVIYSRNQTVWVTAKVWAGASVASGASATFKITKSDGSLVTGTATTDVNGVAAYSLRLARKDPVGTYQASATASLNGASGSGATSFTVK